MKKKKCSKCKTPKSPEEFYRNKRTRDGRLGQCKECNKKRLNKNPEKRSAATKRWRDKNPEKAKALTRKWREENPEYLADAHLKRLYGMTLNDYNEMLAAQEWCCAICGEALEMGEKRHPVDHDHSQSGRESVRGIVHQWCNWWVGKFEFLEKNPGLRDQIKKYIEKHAQKKGRKPR